MSQESSYNEALLQKPLQQLPLSDDFKYFADETGFETLKELISFHAASLLETEGFTLHLFVELVAFLKKEGLYSLLKQ